MSRVERGNRLLSGATRLFYAEGINTVGVDRIVRESGVTIATFYRHFRSKEDLVIAYLHAAHEFVAQGLAAKIEGVGGREMIAAIGEDVSSATGRPGFSGCAFLNAAAEYEEADSAVRRVVADHRRWYYQLVRRAFADAGHIHPGHAARHFVMLRDGSMSAGYLDTTRVARHTFTRGVNGLRRSIDIEQSSNTCPPMRSTTISRWLRARESPTAPTSNRARWGAMSRASPIAAATSCHWTSMSQIRTPADCASLGCRPAGKPARSTSRRA